MARATSRSLPRTLLLASVIALVANARTDAVRLATDALAVSERLVRRLTFSVVAETVTSAESVAPPSLVSVACFENFSVH